MKAAIISFPGNNCEIETLRAAKRNGFEAELVRWNEVDKIGSADLYILGGGFSFEDRGRSGAIAAREPIFDAIRDEAKQGKIILGICNGAQMIVESGLIPVGDNPLPFALAENVRRDNEGHVLGTGYYNTWSRLKVERTDTAFTCAVNKSINVPIAHGEGRFTSVDDEALSALKSGSHVAFRYCDEDGDVDAHFPTTPNGAAHAVGMIVNTEGTVGAIMPHPERFYDACDGDQVFQSIKQWLEEKRSPDSVHVGNFSNLPTPEPQNFERKQGALYLSKRLLITDNEAFSMSEAASRLAGENVKFKKTTLYEIEISPSPSGRGLGRGFDELQESLLTSGLLLNPNKEALLPLPPSGRGLGGGFAPILTQKYDDDHAVHLSEQLSALLGQEVKINIYTGWDAGDASENALQKILQDNLLINPNGGSILNALQT